MKKHGSAVAAGGPAREQAREAVPVEARRTGRARCREVRDASAARQPSRRLCACVLAEAEARAEAVPARRWAVRPTYLHPPTVQSGKSTSKRWNPAI